MDNEVAYFLLMTLDGPEPVVQAPIADPSIQSAVGQGMIQSLFSGVFPAELAMFAIVLHSRGID